MPDECSTQIGHGLLISQRKEPIHMTKIDHAECIGDGQLDQVEVDIQPLLSQEKVIVG